MTRHYSTPEPLHCAAGISSEAIVPFAENSSIWHLPNTKTKVAALHPDLLAYVPDPRVSKPILSTTSANVPIAPEEPKSEIPRAQVAAQPSLTSISDSALFAAMASSSSSSSSGSNPQLATLPASNSIPASFVWQPVLLRAHSKDSEDLCEFELEQPTIACLRETLATEFEVSTSAIKKISRTD